MTEDIFRFTTGNEDLKKWLRSQSNQSKTIKEILNKFRLGEIVDRRDSKEETELEYKKLRNQKLKLDIKLKERELGYMETFDSPPTRQGMKVIKERILTQNEIGNVEKYITLHTNGTGFRGICDFCKLDITEGTRERTLLECTRHLIACHRTEILKE